MSPYPARIERDALIRTARDMIEDAGADQLSLGKLAQAFGVKPPSLYNHIASKTALVQAVNTLTLREQMDAVMAAFGTAEDDPRAALIAGANAYRDYALAHPRAYLLLYASDDPDILPDPDLARDLALPAQALFAALAGADDALHALRGLWAIMHGFVTLEIARQFRRTEGAVTDAWQRTLEAFLDGWGQVSPGALD